MGPRSVTGAPLHSFLDLDAGRRIAHKLVASFRETKQHLASFLVRIAYIASSVPARQRRGFALGISGRFRRNAHFSNTVSGALSIGMRMELQQPGLRIFPSSHRL